MKNIIKTAALTLSVGAILMSTGCSTKVETPKTEPQLYTAYGRYYTDGTVITNDGNDSMWWEYNTTTISDKKPYDAMPVWIAFNDNATPNDITDDIIIGLVYDRETAIYDKLETELGDSFELERDGNDIRIQTLKKETIQND